MAKQVLWRLTLSYKNWKNNRILQKSGSVWIWILGVGVTGMLNLGDVKFRVCWILEVHWQGWRAWNLAVGCLRNLLFLKILETGGVGFPNAVEIPTAQPLNHWSVGIATGQTIPTGQPLTRGDCYGSTVDPWGFLRLNPLTRGDCYGSTRWPVAIREKILEKVRKHFENISDSLFSYFWLSPTFMMKDFHRNTIGIGAIN